MSTATQPTVKIIDIREVFPHLKMFAGVRSTPPVKQPKGFRKMVRDAFRKVTSFIKGVFK